VAPDVYGLDRRVVLLVGPLRVEETALGAGEHLIVFI
jgi:hypothetical protein